MLPGWTDDFESLRLRTLLLGREHLDDGDALDLELGLGPHDVARLRARIEELGVKRALGLLGSRGPPCPGPVVAGAGQLDVDPAGHRASTYNAA